MGWGLLRPGANSDYLGPLHCARNETAIALASTLLQATDEHHTFWDIPDANEFAKAAAKELGFAPVRPLTRMRLGPALAAAPSRALWAIADPALG